MFSYYALETWLFSFFALLLLGFIIFYTKRLITILIDMRRSNKKVSYKPWEMEKKVAKGKVKVPRRFGPIKGLVRESAITSKKVNDKLQSKCPTAPTCLNTVDGIATISGNLSRSSSLASGISYETTTTNSEFYRESRLSVSEMVKDDGSWISKQIVDQNQNTINNNNNNNNSNNSNNNDLQSHLNPVNVEIITTHLPKVTVNGGTTTSNNSNNYSRFSRYQFYRRSLHTVQNLGESDQ